MELKSILFSRIAWPGRLVLPDGGIHLERTVEVMREYFRFVEYPKRIEDFDTNRGIIFRHGEFSSGKFQSGRFVIGELQVFANGIVIASQASTEDMDAFLDIWLKIVNKNLQTGFSPDQERGKGYTSHLEVEMTKSLPISESETRLVTLLSERFPASSGSPPQFEKSGFSIAFDTSAISLLMPSRFTIARRDGFPYSSNLYFSEAPLSTSDHLAILKEFDKSLPA